MRGNAIVGQSGGPTAVINQTLVGVIEACRDAEQVDRTFGAIHGIQGILNGELCDLDAETPQVLEEVANTPSSALLSVRKKPSREECQAIVERLVQLDVKFFFYIGGNDTAETAHIISQVAREAGAELSAIHLPKTIDNDLRVTDHCPGYGSAARFVASAFIGDNLDNRALGGVKINVVMGRDAGWLTAASVLAQRYEDDGPHLVYVPEVDFDLSRFCADVTQVYQRLGRCVVAVSEGIHGPNGSEIIDLSEVDSHGNRQLSGSGALGDALAAALKEYWRQHLPDQKVRLRADTFGYVQRQLPGIISSVDAWEGRQVGHAGVAEAVRGNSGSIIIKRVGEGDDYRVAFELTELRNVARETKPMPREWINEAGNGIVQQVFVPYLKPLIGDLPPYGRLKLQRVQVPKSA